MSRYSLDPERGASGVLVAVMMLVLLGAGALAVDAGQIYAERAQLQNGADGAALAVAQVCHKATCTQAQADSLATELLNANANDGASALSGSVEMDVAGQWTVRTTTRDGTSGAGFLSQMFASALDAPPATVGAYAVAGAAPLGAASGFPLALSNTCWNLTTASDTATVQKISYKPGGTCTGPSGTEIPGGWGWLDQDAPCRAASTLGSNELGSDPGNNPPAGCSAILAEWRATILAGGEVKVPFPVFDDATNNGQNGRFNIIGYATFKIWGWKFGNNHDYEFRNTASDPGMTTDLACSAGQDRCIIGQFVKFESIDSTTGGPGGGANLGTVQIRLVQ
ncbi:pilus assembly protein TadG-related protein [Pseudarthrobacter sp. J75]|uniref:pilus assembly protein TadG-related protein n=1 Tax=unclassified Pseudarthrobacter TaxID=2647000 RepID=UPI002E815ACD|nr:MULTISPECIES: pilus assembly protein TadG-related protein [unclassified Pseudarthrobacter]MEE2521191.1 pilus assembly protein TadG-related protein [Pseudarthrobacter sp. J47]MEE2528421.1 pilus assembly protein TadG-related protein [Pseudarthrobacter sp. J75]